MAGEAKAEVADEFDKAFEELAVAAAAAPVKAATESAPAEETKTPEQIAAEEVAAVKAAADAKAAEEAAAETPEAKAAREAAEAKTVADAKISADARAAEEARAAVAAAAKPPEETPEAKAAREAAEEAVRPYEPSEEEKEALARFKKDFPNEYAAMEARLKSVDRAINARVAAAVQSVMQTVQPRLTAVETTAGNTEAERHFTALHTAHPDYDQVIEKVPAWIKTQPAYLQPAMQAVYDRGTTQDVTQLVADFKKATGVTGDAGATAAAAKKAAEDAAARKRVEDAAALAPVGTRRSAPAQTGSADKTDYNAAWDELEAATK